MDSRLCFVAVTEMPKGTPYLRRFAKARRILAKTPFPRLSSVSFSRPSTDMAGEMLPHSCSLAATSSVIRVPLV